MYTTNNQPQAYVTVGKNRLKKGTDVYLKNGQEFEIELFNPQTETLLAKIWFNDEIISGGGIVLRPGEKVYLERYLDETRKFKFETYDVSAKNKEVENAIRNNGKVRIQFFSEVKNNNGYITLINDGNWYNGNPNYPINPWNNYHFGTCNGPVMGDTLTGNSTCNFMNVSDANYTSNVCMDSMSLLSDSLENSKSNKTKETGRIEKGGISNQTFTYVNKTFSSWAFSTYDYQILPLSVKPVTKSDIKVYCVGCGGRQRKDSHKFCPQCGSKYE